MEQNIKWIFTQKGYIRNILYATAKVSVRLGVTMETRDKDSVKFLVISCLLCLFFHQNKLPEPSSEPHNTQLCCQRHTGLLPLAYLTKKRGAWLLTHSSSMNESPVSRREVLSLPWVTYPERHLPAREDAHPPDSGPPRWINLEEAGKWRLWWVGSILHFQGEALSITWVSLKTKNPGRLNLLNQFCVFK